MSRVAALWKLLPPRWSIVYPQLLQTRRLSVRMHQSSEDNSNPQEYTSGRWLRHDRLQRESRHIKFDFEALCEKVLTLSPGATSIVSWIKREGGFNRVFLFTLDNDERLVARLPTSVAGPSRLITNSEVATIKYLKSQTSIPIPTVVDWSDDPSNSVGHEYIIMEHASGAPLHQKWPAMTGEQRITCIENVSRNIKQMAAIDFPLYGSLYLADAPIDPAFKRPLAHDFCIGPHCGAMYWDCNVGEPRYYHSVQPNRGPWSNLAEFCAGLIDVGRSRLPPTDPDLSNFPSYHGSIADHVSLLDLGHDVLKSLTEDPRILKAAAPTLLHPDLHMRNIFVSDNDPAIVTGIIDWQSASIEPAFMYANDTPDFATLISSESVGDRKASISADLCSQAFDACMKGLVPKLALVRELDENLLRPFRYCHRTWRDGAIAFRHELVELSIHWKDMGFAGSCPFPLPTSEELLVHRKKMEAFELAQKLKHSVVRLLNTTSDGWIPMDLWETALMAHKEVYDEVLRTVTEGQMSDGQGMSEQDLRALWPFDIPPC